MLRHRWKFCPIYIWRNLELICSSVYHQHYETSPEIYKSINRVFSEHLFRSLHTKLKGSWRDNSIECSLELFPLIKSQRAKSREMTERLGELSTTIDRIKCTQYRVEKSGFWAPIIYFFFHDISANELEF